MRRYHDAPTPAPSLSLSVARSECALSCALSCAHGMNEMPAHLQLLYNNTATTTVPQLLNMLLALPRALVVVIVVSLPNAFVIIQKHAQASVTANGSLRTDVFFLSMHWYLCVFVFCFCNVVKLHLSRSLSPSCSLPAFVCWLLGPVCGGLSEIGNNTRANNLIPTKSTIVVSVSAMTKLRRKQAGKTVFEWKNVCEKAKEKQSK